MKKHFGFDLHCLIVSRVVTVRQQEEQEDGLSSARVILLFKILILSLTLTAGVKKELKRELN